MVLCCAVLWPSSGFGAERIEAAAAKGRTTNVAFVLLAKPRAPKGEEIVRAFGHFATTKDRRLRLKEGKTDPKTKIEVMEFELTPGGIVFVTLMPMPVPNGEADHAAQLSVSALGTGWKLPLTRPSWS